MRPSDHPLFESARRGTRCRARSARACATRRARSSARSAAAITTSTCSSTKRTRIWVGVHFGSRGFGHTVASGFLALSPGREVGRARARARGAAVARSADGPGLLGADDARRRLRLRRPRVGGAQGGRRSSAGASSSSCTTITTSPGARSTTAQRSSSCARARRRRFPVRRGSSAARWATMR